MSNSIQPTNDTTIEQIRSRYELTPSELKFVLEYVVDFDVERAYMSVFELYEDERNPRDAALSLLQKPEIYFAIVSELNYFGSKMLIQKEALIAMTFREATNMRSKPAERLKAIEMLARMSGNLDFQKGEAPPQINITINDPSSLKEKGEKITVIDSVPNYGPVTDVESPDDPVLEIKMKK